MRLLPRGTAETPPPLATATTARVRNELEEGKEEEYGKHLFNLELFPVAIARHCNSRKNYANY